MKTLYFQNPTFRRGLNLTVRRGIKWATLEDDKVNIGLTNYGVLGTATIDRILVYRFDDIDRDLLYYEHDWQCRKLDGLFDEMCNVYNRFDRHEIVTLIFFSPEELDEKYYEN